MSTGWVLDEKRLPALPVLLRQPGGDLLGGPEAPEGSVEINSQLLDPRWGVGSFWLLRCRPASPHPSPAIPEPSLRRCPRCRFCPAHREFVFVDSFICQLHGSGQGLGGDARPIAQCSGFRPSYCLHAHKGPESLGRQLGGGSGGFPGREQGGGRDGCSRDPLPPPLPFPPPP